MSTCARYTQRALPDNLLIRKLQDAANAYAQYADKDILIIYSENKNGPFLSYEFYAGKKIFSILPALNLQRGLCGFLISVWI